MSEPAMLHFLRGTVPALRSFCFDLLDGAAIYKDFLHSVPALNELGICKYRPVPDVSRSLLLIPGHNLVWLSFEKSASLDNQPYRSWSPEELGVLNSRCPNISRLQIEIPYFADMVRSLTLDTISNTNLTVLSSLRSIKALAAFRNL